MRMKIITIVFSVILMALATQCEADSFDRIKERLTTAECVRFDFISIIESDVFDLTDSCTGTAYIARDGRYRMELDSDIYLYEGKLLYSYSVETNQLIIEKPDTGATGQSTGDEIGFVANFNEFYETYTITQDLKYRLLRKGDQSSNIPDSMIVFINSKVSELSRIEYFDVNGERNLILFLRQQADSTCTPHAFEPVFPDSAERVKLF